MPDVFGSAVPMLRVISRQGGSGFVFRCKEESPVGLERAVKPGLTRPPAHSCETSHAQLGPVHRNALKMISVLLR
jgi:hypothetical protein